MCLSLFSQPAFSTFPALYRQELIKVHTSNARHLYPHGLMKCPGQGKKLVRICTRAAADSPLVFNQAFLFIPDLPHPLISSLSRWNERKDSWEVGQLGHEGVSALHSLVTAACTCRQGLNPAPLHPPPPGCGKLLHFGTCSTVSKVRMSPDGRDSSRSRESSEQHKTPSDKCESKSKRKRQLLLFLKDPEVAIPTPSCWFLLFCLPRQTARTVTSELAADFRGYHHSEVFLLEVFFGTS